MDTDEILKTITRSQRANRVVKDMIRLKGSFMVINARKLGDKPLEEAINKQLEYINSRRIGGGEMYYLENFCNQMDINQPILDESEIAKTVSRWREDMQDIVDKKLEPIKNNQIGLLGDRQVLLGTLKSGIIRNSETIESFEGYNSRYALHIMGYLDKIKAEESKINNNLEVILEKQENSISLEDSVTEIENRKDGDAVKYTNFELEFIKIIKSGNWIFYGNSTDSRYYKFFNRVPIICVESNKAAGVDRRVDCGHISISINPITCEYRTGRFYKNRFSGAYDSSTIHPHVCCPSICWGSSQGTQVKLAKSGSWLQWFNLLDALLVQFYPRNPYISMTSLVKLKVSENIEDAFKSAPRWVHEMLITDESALIEAFPMYSPDYVEGVEEEEEEEEDYDGDGGVGEATEGMGTGNFIIDDPLADAIELPRRYLPEQALEIVRRERSNSSFTPSRSDTSCGCSGCTRYRELLEERVPVGGSVLQSEILQRAMAESAFRYPIQREPVPVSMSLGGTIPISTVIDGSERAIYDATGDYASGSVPAENSEVLTVDTILEGA